MQETLMRSLWIPFLQQTFPGTRSFLTAFGHELMGLSEHCYLLLIVILQKQLNLFLKWLIELLAIKSSSDSSSI
jgi:hypothetical protein